MGQIRSRPQQPTNSKKPDIVILLDGINQAGQTTTLFQLKFGEPPDDVVPTSDGGNIELVKFQNGQYAIYDIGDESRNRSVWQYYYRKAEGLIWVVDSSGREDINEVNHELDRLLHDSALRDIPVLIYGNKRDLPNAMSDTELADKLGLKTHDKHRWHIQSTCATRGKGLWQGFKWLHDEIMANRKKLR